MRTIVVVAIALAAMSLTSTFANAGTWCGTYKLGSTSCGYSSSEECLATVRGLGGFCQPNPFPGTAYGTSAGSWNPPDSPRRYRPDGRRRGGPAAPHVDSEQFRSAQLP